MATSSRDARARIMAAARAKFLGRGFVGTSMEEIRVDAGVSNGSLFHHFPTKHHLVRELYLEAMRSYREQLAQLLREQQDRQAGDIVEAMVDAMISWVVNNRDLAFIFGSLRAETTIDGVEIDFYRVNAYVIGELRVFVDERIARGELMDIPFHVWLALVFGPVLQLSALWVKPNPPRVTASARAALIRAARLAVAKEHR